MGKRKPTSFPKPKDFKNFNRFRNWAKIPNITQIIRNARNITDFKKLLPSKRDIQRIETRTRGQAKNRNWFHYKQSMITGTMTKRVGRVLRNITEFNKLPPSKRIETRPRGQAKNRKLFHYKQSIITGTMTTRVGAAREASWKLNKSIDKPNISILYYPAIVYGRVHESDAKNAFLAKYKQLHTNLKIQDVGLKLDDTNPILGGSADGVVSCSCCPDSRILEVKCSYKYRDTLIDREALACMKNGKLNPTHPYYAQLMTYLGIYNYELGYFVVWTPADIVIVEVPLDRVFWDKLKNDSIMYYYNHYLPQYGFV